MLNFFAFSNKDSKDWDGFVTQNPHGSIHQMTSWRNFQCTIPGREEVLGFGLKKNGKIIAVTWCVKMSTGALGKHWYYSARGPIFSDSKDIKTIRYFLDCVGAELQKKNGIFWRLDPYFTNEDWYSVREQKINFPISSATKNFQPTDSLLLDITKDEVEIRAQMKRTGRRNLKKAENSGVKIEMIDPEKVTQNDVADFYRLNLETTTRDKFSGHESFYYYQFITQLAPFTKLFFANYQGERIAGSIGTFCHQKSIYYFGASTSNPSYRNLRAPYLLQWSMIKEAKLQGCKTYDFTGITPVDEPNHPYKGITQFKTRFGGYRSTFAPGKEIVLDKFWYAAYKIIKKFI